MVEVPQIISPAHTDSPFYLPFVPVEKATLHGRDQHLKDCHKKTGEEI